MKRFIAVLFITAVLMAAFSTNSFLSFAQGRDNQADLTIEAKTRTEIIEAVLKNLLDYYVFPEVAQQTEKSIRERLQRKEYDRITSATELATVLTTQIREISRDNHLRVIYSDKPLSQESEDEENPEERERQRRNSEARNFGFNRVERLPGNIGYLSLSYFEYPDWGGGIATAAMNFLSNTDALIIDLRNNNGGQPEMSILLATYLFDKPVHYVDYYTRESRNPQQFWTQPYVPGKRYLGKDVYLLISERTFSAGEGFAYNLKALGRVTIIGENTHGGANPGSTHWINEHYEIFVPDARSVNPITGTNWGATGVKPDIAVSAESALKTAQLLALKKLVEKNPADSLAEERKTAIESLQKQLDEMKK